MNRLLIIGVSMAMVFAAVLRTGDAADAPATPTADQLSDPVQELRDAVTAIRHELAAAKLELQIAQRELRVLRDYLASTDPQADVQKWKVQRQAIDDERKEIALERKRLDAARQSLRDATRVTPSVKPETRSPQPP